MYEKYSEQGLANGLVLIAGTFVLGTAGLFEGDRVQRMVLIQYGTGMEDRLQSHKMSEETNFMSSVLNLPNIFTSTVFTAVSPVPQ